MKLWQHFEACNEVSYIMSVNPCNPGPTFNDDPQCFDDYRNMQSRHAAASGHQEQAEQMLRNPSWPVWRQPKA